MKNQFLQNLFERKYQGNNVSLCRDTMESFADSLIKLLFPALCNSSASDLDGLDMAFHSLSSQLDTILDCLHDELGSNTDKERIKLQFQQAIVGLEEKMNLDAEFALETDPAAKSLNEVVICYPGFYAIAIYRIAHFFWKEELPLFPRILTEYAHRKTGIDIHPGAEIQAPFFIDHGTGVVIGETTIIGKRVKIFQGVTLGATSVNKNLSNVKRHPTIEDDVIIYSNATILGGETTIGKNSIVGGNVWLLKSVAPDSQIFYKENIQYK